MHALARFQVPWATFQELRKEEIAALIATREEELEGMEEELVEVEYVDQEAPEEMEMEDEERKLEVEETVEVVPQEPTSTMGPMEEDGLEQERLGAEEAMELIEEGIMDTMDGVDTLIQESTFINNVPEGIVPTPST